jgi:hypothetical protein
MTTPTEPRNPFYLLLLLASLLFVITALAYAFVPTLERMAQDSGTTIQHSLVRDSLVNDGWLWLFVEVAAIVVLSGASMVYDRLRTLQTERAAATIVPAKPEETTTP